MSDASEKESEIGEDTSFSWLISNVVSSADGSTSFTKVSSVKPAASFVSASGETFSTTSSVKSAEFIMFESSSPERAIVSSSSLFPKNPEGSSVAGVSISASFSCVAQEGRAFSIELFSRSSARSFLRFEISSFNPDKSEMIRSKSSLFIAVFSVVVSFSSAFASVLISFITGADETSSSSVIAKS